MNAKSTEVEDELNSRLELALKRLARPVRPPHQVSAAPPKVGVESPITRARCLRRVRYLVSTYHFDWIVAQWTELLGPLKGMGNAELVAVVADLDLAYDCLREGIPLEDVFLDPLTDERMRQRASVLGVAQTN